MRTEIHQDGRELTINRVQDVEPILDNNKRLQNQAQDRNSSFRHVASIPNVILEKWLNEERLRGNASLRWGSREFDNLVRRKLNDPDYAYLRTDRRRTILRPV